MAWVFEKITLIIHATIKTPFCQPSTIHIRKYREEACDASQQQHKQQQQNVVLRLMDMHIPFTCDTHTLSQSDFNTQKTRLMSILYCAVLHMILGVS